LLRFLSGVTSIATVTSIAAAQNPVPVTIQGTEVRELTSAKGIHYRLYVSLPPGYGEAGRTYPVLYMLDADYSFAIAHNITDHLTVRGDLPPVLLVAIAYDPAGQEGYRLNRTRDYTPTHVDTGGYGPEYQRLSGGAPDFLTFIRRELIPFIGRTYAVSEDRTLMGHSYGSLFALWAMLDEPGLFNRMIAVSPSIWYDDRLLLQLLAKRKASLPPVRIYFGVGGREPLRMATDAEQYAAELNSLAAFNGQVAIHVVPSETHNSIFPIALTEGLRWVYGPLGAR